MSLRTLAPAALLLVTACGSDAGPESGAGERAPGSAASKPSTAAPRPAAGDADALARVQAFLDEQAPLADADAWGIDRRVASTWEG